MNIKMKRFDKELPLPVYKSKGAVCVDLFVRENTTIQPGEVAIIPLNIALEVPKGYWSLLAARSSAHKMGIMPVNGLGIIDEDYCGDDDELKFAALNFTKVPVTIEKASRIAQLMVLKSTKMDITEVQKMDKDSRGGFGSTGTK